MSATENIINHYRQMATAKSRNVGTSDADVARQMSDLLAACDAERKTTQTDGSPVTPDHREINPATGMQKAYVVLSSEERAKGFVRPVRRKYAHTKCGTVTTMAQALAETYARDPFFYSGTFCCGCRKHFPVGPADMGGEFRWDGSDEMVGT